MGRPPAADKATPKPPVWKGPLPPQIDVYREMLHAGRMEDIPASVMSAVLFCEWEDICSDFTYYLRHYAPVYIKGRGGKAGWQRLCPNGEPRIDDETNRSWAWQLDLSRYLADSPLALILKARQIGLTYLLCNLVVWTAMTGADQPIIIIANKMGTARGLVQRCIRIHRELPDWLREASPVANEAVSNMVFGNGSSVVPLSSRSDTGRSTSAVLVVVDEAAFVESFTDVFASIEACADGGGRVVMVTTANGTDNLVYDMAMDGTSGDIIGSLRGDGMGDSPVWWGLNGMTFAFLPWWCDPARDEAWREAKLLNYKKSLSLFKQEYPSDITEAFVTTGMAYFDSSIVRERHEPLAEQYRQVSQLGDIVCVNRELGMYRFEPSPSGVLTLHATADELAERLASCIPFVIGADSAGSAGGGDFHAASAVQLPAHGIAQYVPADTETPPAVQLFTIHGHFSANVYSELLARLGYFLGTALIVPEANGVGMSVIDSLRRMRYPRLFMREPSADRIRNILGSSRRTHENAYGFYTTGPLKQQIYGTLDHAVRTHSLEIRDPDTVSEMLKVSHLGTSRIGAKEPYHDDRPDGLALAVGHLHRARPWRGPLRATTRAIDPWDTVTILGEVMRAKKAARDGHAALTRGGTIWR